MLTSLASICDLMLQDRPGFNEDGTPVKLTKRKKAALVADKVIVQGVLKNTVGRVGRVAGRLLLGRIPDTAKEGSFQEEKPLAEADTSAPSTPEMSIETKADEPNKYIDVVDDEDKSLLEGDIFDQVFANGSKFFCFDLVYYVARGECFNRLLSNGTK